MALSDELEALAKKHGALSANARLIAAAPELLEAAIELKDVCNRPSAARTRAEAWRKLDKAIAKALQPNPDQAQAVAVPLTDEQIEDLLICGNPTDEEKRLIRMGWDAAHGIKGGQHGTE